MARIEFEAGVIGQRLAVNPADLSDVLGHRGENREWLKLIDPAVSVASDETVERGFLRMSGSDVSLNELTFQGV